MRYLAIAVALVLVTSASADWSDNFDLYNLGSINNQGGWQGWANAPAAAGTVTNEISRSPSQSQRIEGAADSVHTYSGYTNGVWIYRAWVYVPTDFQSGGTAPDIGTYFIMLNKYTAGGSDTRWSVQVAFDSTDHMVHADCGSSDEVTMPYVAGAWSSIEVQAYLGGYGTDGWCKIFYNGTLLDDPGLANHPTLGGGYAWRKGVFGTDTDGILNIGGVDLYANSSTAVFYDDMSLVPEPASCLLLALAALLRRR
jgi:hypothetical protein